MPVPPLSHGQYHIVLFMVIEESIPVIQDDLQGAAAVDDLGLAVVTQPRMCLSYSSRK